MDDTGGNYLQLAVNCSNPVIIYDLIPYIRDINGKNVKNQTVLHYAAAAGLDYDVISFLIKSGADKSIKDINGKTACDIYVEYYSMYDDTFELLKIR